MRLLKIVSIVFINFICLLSYAEEQPWATEQASNPAPMQSQTQELKPSTSSSSRQIVRRPKSAEEIQREMAFSGVANQLLPLSPKEIAKLKKMLSLSQQAASSPALVAPKPVSNSLVVSLAPGATPPVVRLGMGYVSSLVFIDSTGAAWPIEAYDIGNPNAFNIQGQKRSNVLMVQSRTAFTVGNLAVKLDGLATPVMLTLIPGQQVIDYRVDLRVEGQGPDAKPLSSVMPNHASPVLLTLLDGIAPKGSQSLKVIGAKAQAWYRDKKVYIRTRSNIISPGWLETMQSADGMHAYIVQRTPLILLSQHGKVVEMKLEGF